MRFLFLFSAILSLIPFLIGVVISLFLIDIPWQRRMAVPVIPAFCTFIASLILGIRDSRNHSQMMRQIHSWLMKRPDTSDREFLKCQSCDDPELLISIRGALAHFYSVPRTKIERNVDLSQDLQIGKVDYLFQLVVVEPLIALRQTEPKPFTFTSSQLTSIDELANEVQKVLDESESA